MDGRFAAALQDVSPQLIIQQHAFLPSSFLLSSLLVHLLPLLFISRSSSSPSNPDFPKWDSNQRFPDHGLALSITTSPCRPTSFSASSCFLFLHLLTRLPLSPCPHSWTLSTSVLSLSPSLPLSLRARHLFSSSAYFLKNSYKMHLETCDSGTSACVVAFFSLITWVTEIKMQLWEAEKSWGLWSCLFRLY